MVEIKGSACIVVFMYGIFLIWLYLVARSNYVLSRITYTVIPTTIVVLTEVVPGWHKFTAYIYHERTEIRS